MSHRNAPLTPTGRLRPARCVVEDCWSLRRTVELFQVSHSTTSHWADRYWLHGRAGMVGQVQPPAPPAAPHTRRRGGRGRPAGRSTASARCGRRPVSAWPRPPPTGCSSAVGCLPWRCWTGPPASPSAAMNAPGPANWSTSTSRSWAASPTAEATRSSAARLAARTRTAATSSDRPTCTPPWTTTPASHTRRTCRTRPPRPAQPS